MACKIDITTLERANEVIERNNKSCKRQRNLLEMFLGMTDTSQIQGYSPRDVLTACEFFKTTAENKMEKSNSSILFMCSVLEKPRIKTRRLF